MLRAVGRLLHVDDDERLTRYRQLISGDEPIAIDELSERERRLLRMLLASLVTSAAVTSMRAAMDALWAHRQVRSELNELLDVLDDRIDHLQPMLGAHADIPLHVHARYTRIEIQAAMNDGTALRPPRWDSGVKWLPDERTDVFAFTLDKTSGDFSPTTRYQDYAISPELIHWESQSMTSLASPTGTRYVNQLRDNTERVLVRSAALRRSCLLVPRAGHVRPARRRAADRDYVAARPSPSGRPVHDVCRRCGVT